MAVVFTTFDLALDAGSLSDGELAALYDRLKTVPGVEQSGYQAELDYTGVVEAEALTQEARAALGEAGDGAVELPFTVQFLDDASYRELVGTTGLSVEDYTGEHGELIAVAKLDGDLCEDLFTEQSLQLAATPQMQAGAAAPPQEMRLKLVTLTVPDSIPTLGEGATPRPYVFQVFAPYSRKNEMALPGAVLRGRGMTFCSDTPVQTMKALQAALNAAAPGADCHLWNLSKLLEDNNMIFIANVFAYTFVAMISLIAVANVFNTVSTNIRLRRRELAMYRSIGMAEGDFQKMLNLECLFYGLRALAWGLPPSGLACWGDLQGNVPRRGGRHPICAALAQYAAQCPRRFWHRIPHDVLRHRSHQKRKHH